MAKEMWGLKAAALVLALLVVQPEYSVQLNVNHPLHGVVQRINAIHGPFLAIIVSSSRDERTLMDSGYFVPDKANPLLTIAGRKLRLGMFRGTPTIVTKAESPLANVAVTAQLMMDTFHLRGIIHYGAAGAVANALEIGDVVVPESVGYTGVWQWEEYESSLRKGGDELPSLRFGDYNVPEAGENKLASIHYKKVTQYNPSGSNEEAFWLPVNSDWVRIASGIKRLMLEKCVDNDMSNCVLRDSEIIHGVKAASSDIFVSNEAYADFLHKELGASTVDTTSAAVVSAAIANRIPHIVFRGAANKPGLEVSSDMQNMVSRNVLEVVAHFVNRITPMPRTTSY